ncbi:ABC transporter permease [Lapillicoccus sp.]|uniref:ABC transporter permease n=1 Tax=Lapillicoccus sp. TaxID=1909287 RepID=UPI003263EAF9
MQLATRGDRQQTRLRTELISQLIRKDLKVKYQGSSLGFIWSLANPMLLLVVYTFVFAVVFKSQVPKFGLFLMSGLLIWSFFTMGVSGAATSILGNAGLVKKVPFPHSALPLASVGFAGVQVALQYAVLIVALFVFEMPPVRIQLLLLIPALVVALMMTVGLGFFVAASTVRLRDTQHILEVALFAWMWLTPIIYPATLVQHFLGTGTKEWLYYLNPMSGVVISFQRALYGVVYYPGTQDLLLPSASTMFYVEALGIGFVVAAGVLALGIWQFRRLSADFAEDL